MEKILKSFLKRLTNISSNNRSVCLLKLYREQFFDLHRLDFLYKQPSFTIISQLIAGKRKIVLCDEMDSRDETVNEISKTIRRIFRREKLLFEESGARDLYVGWPFVKGKLSDGSPVRCPLLFFPVTLTLENGKWYILQREDAEVSLNKNFLLAYAHFNNVKIDDEWIESSFEDFDKEPTPFRTNLYEFMKASPLEINFNQELFTDRLDSFKEYKAEEYNQEHRNGELKLFQEAILGIFPQAGSYLVPDYEELISQNKFADLEDFLKSKVQEEDPHKIKEENSYTVFRSDASQESALNIIKEGKSLVVQGPPGTGKSQLICNLISDFAARGKKVMLVCQKKAALDVVYERLHKKQVDPFITLVHDFRNDRTKIFEQIASQIDRIDEYQKQNNGMDTIYLERTFTQASRQIRQNQEELSNFHQALYSTGEFGISAKELYLTTDPQASQIPLKEFVYRFNLETSLVFERKIKNFMPYAFRFMHETYTWYDRVSFAEFYQRDLPIIFETMQKIPLYQKHLQDSTSKTIKIKPEALTLDFFLTNKETAERINHLINEDDDYFLLLELLREKIDKEWLQEHRKKILGCFEKGIPEVYLQLKDFELCEEKIKNYLHSRRNFFSALYWNIFSGDKEYLSEVLAKNNLTLTPDGVSELTNRIAIRRKIEKEKSLLLKKNKTHTFPIRINKKEIEEWFISYFKILEAKELILQSTELTTIIDSSDNDYKIFYDSLNLIPIIAQDVLINYKDWSRYLSSSMINGILNKTLPVEDYKKILRRDFDMLIEFDKQKAELLSFELQIMKMLFDDSLTLTEQEKANLFRNSIRNQWIGILEEKYPVLVTVSNLRMQQMENSLQEAIQEKMKVSTEILQVRLKEESYRDIEYNRLQNRVTYRELYHQVTKKKKLWTLRRLINEFSDELFQLTPCWMVSPEAASALFPLKELFDLVIFDEASQCFSEQGLPAMYRGKQVVIAGDNKQLKPNDLYQARWEDETDDTPDLEIDSLLDLCNKYLPSVQLNGHYRSKNLDLIDFSNSHFYNHSLQLIPYYNDIIKGDPSIHYIAVKGLWENNTNQEEAHKVAQLAIDLLKKEDGKSIGIVTFNFKQAQLITDIVELLSVQQQVLITDDFFVKNIENVQGDEKDIIIFSVGYAPDSRGKFTMQFGSLNLEGGENRLNVAVTRAKEKIYVVASIMPQQLQVAESQHEGPRLLRKYLEYAWQVSEGLYRPAPVTSIARSRDWYLSKKLLGTTDYPDYQLSEELPFADITVKKQEKYYSLIFTDDHLYFHARNSKEVHAYKPMELKEKGWNYKRFFSREYWLKQNDYLELL